MSEEPVLIPNPHPAPRASLVGRLDALDRRLTSAIVIGPAAHGRPRLWVEALRRFSEAGSYGVGWVVLFGVVGVLNDGIVRGVVAAAFVLSMLVTNTLIKKVIKRPRPTVRAILHSPSSWSMPSAHTSMAMVGAATMGVISPDWAPLWWTVAVLLGASRVMLGMHFLGDVLVGAVIGLAVGLLIAAPVVAWL